MIKCPQCGVSNYHERYITSTDPYWKPYFVNGLIINTIPHGTTVYCRCNVCRNDFIYKKEDRNEFRAR